ncbi:MAG TPA: DUF1638 domain-containing protein [Verrucomicrobiota bacterium]|nr:DUF1638 domain-containing protein [Verrucomicrobiota bacterium]HNU52905.1 DUF1638 domain-containing protein [Verrucomicrobiota bacterium]
MQPAPGAPQRYFKVVACEIALREICHAAARSPHILDLEFVTQGHHDQPAMGRVDLQNRIDAIPPDRYDAVLLGYGLCSNMLAGLRSRHHPIAIPRAHDCITWFLGSKERYQECFAARPGTYYYTTGWLECRRRRGSTSAYAGFLPAPASAPHQAFDAWVKQYGEEKARFLLEAMAQWTDHYSHGVWIDFDFCPAAPLREEVREFCRQRGWHFEELPGDLGLLQRWINGEWNPAEVLVVPPHHELVASFDDLILGCQPVP